MRGSTALLMAALGLMAAAPVRGQEAPAPPKPLEVGAPAPDFALPGATRYGVLADSIRLSDFRGKAVVLAFFIRARTPG